MRGQGMNNRGVALILSFILIVVLTILGAASLSRSISESRIARRYLESTQAFWLAEAGINRALNELRINYITSGSGLWSTTMGAGRYEVDVGNVTGVKRLVTSHGCIPDVTCSSSRTQRKIEATMTKETPSNFFNNAIYTPGNVNISGSAYTVTGNVRYGGTITPDPPVKIPSANDIQDTSITTLARFDFDQLRQKSIDQGNYHDATHNPPFPETFWKSPGVPNIVFMEGNFDISGKKEIVGGFIIVGGDLVYDAEISGNAAVDGVIYTLGTCSVKGGGGAAFNVNGGIWAGQGVTVTGSTVIQYNSVYMNAIQNLNLIFTVQISNWNDPQNPYTLVP
jgi:hypothetical protein